ncbi:MAG: hypothetical protein KDB10_05285 [Acidimicrobiales bacterium]|nr:hypothetical protein [Acidimicrobiales bacterium]
MATTTPAGDPTGEDAPGWALRLRLGDVPVRIELSFFLIAALLGASLGSVKGVAIWTAVVLVSVLVHELGHAVAMRWSGVSSRIVLHGLGGLTIPAGAIASRAKRVAVDLAGPLSGLFLLGVPGVWLARTLPDPSVDVELVLLSVVWVNVVWSVVNLLPILPLDGGNVTKELLDVLTGEQGERPARVVSIVVAGAAGLWALRSGMLFAGLFALFFVGTNWRALSERRSGEVVEEVRGAYHALARGDADAALAAATAAVPRAKAPDLRAVAAEVAAWAHVVRDEDDEARRVLGRVPAPHEPSGHVRCVLAEPAAFDRADRINLTVDAWVTGEGLVPPPIYVRRLARDGLLDDVVDRLLASRAEQAPQARNLMRQLVAAAGDAAASARLGPPEVVPGTSPGSPAGPR